MNSLERGVAVAGMLCGGFTWACVIASVVSVIACMGQEEAEHERTTHSINR